MLAFAVAMTLLAQKPPTVAALPLDGVGVAPELLRSVGEHVAELLRSEGVEVVTQGDVAALLGLERQKQLLGCGDDQASCLTELVGALGTDAVLRGQVVKLESQFVIDLKVLRASDGRRLAFASQTFEGVGALMPSLKRLSASLAEQLRPRDAPVSSAVAARRARLWVPVAGGVALLATSGLMFGLAAGSHQDLTTPPRAGAAPLTQAEATARIDQLFLYRGLGIAFAATGAAAVAVGLIIDRATAGPAVVTVAPVLAPGGGGLAVAGSWP